MASFSSSGEFSSSDSHRRCIPPTFKSMGDDSISSRSSSSSDLESKEIYGGMERNRAAAPQLRKRTCEEAKEAFFRGISGRTRSNRDACIGVNPLSSASTTKRKRQEMPTPSVGGQTKTPGFSWKKPFASVEISHEDVSHRRVRVEEGDVALIDKAEFISRKSFSLTKIRSSGKGSLKGGSSSHKPISIILLESDSDEDMMAEDIEIHTFDETEVGSAARLNKNVGGASARKDAVSAHHSMTFTPRDYFTGFDTLADDSTTLADKANNNVGKSFREITSKRNIEGLLKKSKSPYLQADRSGSSAQKVNRDEYRNYEKVGIERISESDFKKRKILSKNGSSNSKQQDEGIATTSAKNVRRVSEKIPSFVKNDGNKRKDFDSSLKRRGDAWNHNVVDADDVDKSSYEFLCSSSSSESSSDDVKKREDSDSSLKRRVEACNHNVDDDDDYVDKSSDEFLCSESGSDDVSTSTQDSEDSSYDPELEMGVGRKTGRSKKASSPPTNSDSGSSLDADVEVGSSHSEVEWLNPPHDACNVLEESEELDELFYYKSDAEEGLNETCSKQPNNEKGQSQEWTTGPKEVAPTTDSKYGSDHCDDDGDDEEEKERTEAISSDFPARAKATKESLAVETKVPSGPKEAALPSHLRDGCDHCRGAKERTEDSHARAKKKTPDMAMEKKVPSGPKEAAILSHLRDGCDHSHDGAKERTEDSHVRAKKKTPGMARETKVPSGPTEAALPSHLRDGYDHSHDGAKERTEDSHVRAKKKTPGMARETKVPSGPTEAALPSHLRDGHDHSHDGAKERTEDSHVRAKKKTPGMARETKVPSGPTEAALPSHLRDGYDHSHDGAKERTEDSHVRAKKKTPGMARETKVPSGPTEAALPSHLRDGYDHSHDGTKERTEDSHVRAKKKTPGMARETKVPSGPKEAALPSHLRDGYDHSHDGAKERIKDSHVPAKKKEATPSSQSKDDHDHSHDETKKRTEAGQASDSHMRAGIASEKKVRYRPTKAATPSHSEDVCDHTDGEKTETGSRDNSWTDAVPMASETEVPREGKKSYPKGVKELCSMLANAVLGNGQFPTDKEIYEEAKQGLAPPTPYTLPLKFRFEDEVPKPVEKTDYEKEIDNLFYDLDCCWALDEVQPLDYPKDNLENENPPHEETQHKRCSKGEHDLVLEDDEGLVCKFCRFQALGPKDIMPEWVERPYRDSERKQRHETEDLFEFDDLHISTNDADAAGSSRNATGTVWNIKPGVRDSMYEHQREGFEFLWKNLAGSIDLDELKSTKPAGVGGCIISHAPGTGKTRLTMVFIETYFKLFPGCRPVIISPASTLLNWEEEFEKWNVEFPFHNLSNTEFSGKESKALVERISQKKRNNTTTRMIKILSWSMVGGILGISYTLFGKLAGEATENKLLRRILLEAPGLVVLDEGHTPRNSRSNIWNALLKLKTEKRIILSGTPFQNNFSELFNTLRIVRPAVADVLAQEKMFAEAAVPKRTSWSSRNKNKREHAQSSLISERALQHLKGCMLPFVNLHTGTILKQSLPGLRDCVILLKPPALQKSVIETIEDSSNFKYEHEVSMLSVHPYLLMKCVTTESRKTGIDMAAVEASELNPQEGVKTKFLMELIRLCMAVNEKVLVFSQYLQPLMLIKEQLKEVFKWAEDKEILTMQGKQTQKERQILINLFNNSENGSKIMLASTKCCAEGISLVGASRVVLLDVVWNPSVERQAICRAYRIGQKKFVHTYHLMTSGTKEDDKYCRQAEKERLSELVFSSSKTNQQKQASLAIEDRILEAMVAHEGLKDMFEKIINQPKETNLIETFGLTN
ncbi:SNF2 domain-containing protein CLASSY 3-like [Salvia splendens]|uniref:SNF2 domain-containing protein CLASSY 3-like n=1 Tax=Salvia splendens TaxID=180675 RepID=UPI001C279AB5|nr:SNF2 domain-containing protein CLASSY 3-like [Salvia splendens]